MFSCGGDNEEEQTDSSTETTDTEVVPDEDEVEEVEIINSYIIEPNVVGIFELEHPVPEKLPEGLKMRQFLEESADDKGNLVEHTHNVVFNQLEDVVELIMEKGDGEHHLDKSIEEMYVLSNYYETPEGVSVGNTVEDFREEYEDATIWYDKIHNHYFLETESILGAQFIINELDIAKKAKGSRDMQKLNFSYVKDGAKIEKIRVY